MQSCLALRFLVKRENDGARERLMNIYFLSNIGPRLACMRTSRKTSARLKITFVDMTYPKGWTGSLLLCPLIFPWYILLWNGLENFICTRSDYKWAYKGIQGHTWACVGIHCKLQGCTWAYYGHTCVYMGIQG